MHRRLPRPKADDILTDDLLNALYDEIQRLVLKPGNNIEMLQTTGGTVVSAKCPEMYWIKITGASATLMGGAVAYPWTEQIPVVGGTWADNYRTGTTSADPAIESTGYTSVPIGSIVLALRADGVLGFLFRACP